MDNFEAFYSIISSSINLLFLRSAVTTKSDFSKIRNCQKYYFFPFRQYILFSYQTVIIFSRLTLQPMKASDPNLAS